GRRRARVPLGDDGVADREPRAAPREAQGRDPRLPVAAVELVESRVVLLRVPERAVVGVEVHGAVVAPATARVELVAGAVDDRRLGPHLARRVARLLAGIADRGADGAASGAVAERQVAAAVHGDAPHPAVDPVARRERALLV